MKRAVAVVAILIVAAGAAWVLWPRSRPVYPIRQVVFAQPLDHAVPDGPTFEQYVVILEPAGVSVDSPVLFVLGGEGNATDARLIRLYEAYGAPQDVIFVQAEHRGYGESLSHDEDQSVPAYVTVDQALADFDAVIQELKAQFTGPWAVAGYSYAGGLAIDLAARYPGDVDAVLSSSGVVDWPFTMDAYDSKVRVVFGEDTYGRVERRLAAYELDDRGECSTRLGYLPKDAPRQVGRCQATLSRPQWKRRLEGYLSKLQADIGSEAGYANENLL